MALLLCGLAPISLEKGRRLSIPIFSELFM